MNRRSKILVVDDNPVNLDIMMEMLEVDFRVRTVQNAAQALRIATAFVPDVVLLDIMLPVIDGYTLCRHLRELPMLRKTKIIMVSAKAMPSEQAEGFGAGADAYLTKPFDEGELLSLIRTLNVRDGDQHGDKTSSFASFPD